MSADEPRTEGKAPSRGARAPEEPTVTQDQGGAADEDQFTKASAIVASRAIAGVSPHVMAGALYDKADDDQVTRQEAADAVAKLRERPKDEEG